MTTYMKLILNELALNLAMQNGQKFENDYDFSKTTDLFGIHAWNSAVMSWAILKNDKPVLKYQKKFNAEAY